MNMLYFLSLFLISCTEDTHMQELSTRTSATVATRMVAKGKRQCQTATWSVAAMRLPRVAQDGATQCLIPATYVAILDFRFFDFFDFYFLTRVAGWVSWMLRRSCEQQT